MPPGGKTGDEMKRWTLVWAALLFVLSNSFAQAQTDYRINPGDTLNVEVLEDGSLNRSVVVLPDGRFSFPFAGTVQAAGRTIRQVEIALIAALGPNFASDPNVFVSVIPRQNLEEPPAEIIEEEETIDIFFIGELASPGQRTIPEGITLLQAISLTGGFTRFAAIKRIQLRRPNPKTGQQQIFQFDFKAISNGAQLNDMELKDGDVIIVPERRLFE